MFAPLYYSITWINPQSSFFRRFWASWPHGHVIFERFGCVCMKLYGWVWHALISFRSDMWLYFYIYDICFVLFCKFLFSQHSYFVQILYSCFKFGVQIPFLVLSQISSESLKFIFEFWRLFFVRICPYLLLLLFKLVLLYSYIYVSIYYYYNYYCYHVFIIILYLCL